MGAAQLFFGKPPSPGRFRYHGQNRVATTLISYPPAEPHGVTIVTSKIEAIALKNLQGILREKGYSAESLFSKYDLDGDGTLSTSEFESALRAITGQVAPDAIVKAVFGALDQDSDGSINLEEMLAVIDSGGTQELHQGDGVTVSEHPDETYNRVYEAQETQKNGRPWFRSPNGRILYFYNANSGGAPSWSLDDREQDGSNDWYRGGWTRPPGGDAIPIGTRRWVGVGKITLSPSGPGNQDSPRQTPSDSAVIEIRLARSSFKADEKIDFSFSAPKFPDDAWIGIVPADIPHGDEAVNDQHETGFKYLEGRTSGGFTLPNPGPGQWTMRLHDTDHNGREIAYSPFTVTDPPLSTQSEPESTPPPPQDDLSTVLSDIDGIIASIEDNAMSGEISMAEARSSADSVFEARIDGLPSFAQNAARSVWEAKMDVLQIRIESRMPSSEKIAAGAVGAVVAGGVAAGMRDNAETATTTPVPEREASLDWHKAHHVGVTQDVNPPERAPDRVTHPGESAEEITTPPAPQQTTTTPQSPEPTPEATPPVPTTPTFIEAAEAFAAARMLSERNQIKESYEGRSQEASIRVNSIERTFGIGISDSYRGGSTLIAEAEGVGEVEIRLPADSDVDEYHSGTEASLTVSIVDWNAVRRRLILEAQ